MAAAADERLLLTTAELVGIDAEELGTLKADTESEPEPITAVTALPAATPPEIKRAPGFVATLAPAIDAHATVMGRLELPRW